MTLDTPLPIKFCCWLRKRGYPQEIKDKYWRFYHFTSVPSHYLERTYGFQLNSVRDNEINIERQGVHEEAKYLDYMKDKEASFLCVAPSLKEIFNTFKIYLQNK